MNKKQIENIIEKLDKEHNHYFKCARKSQNDVLSFPHLMEKEEDVKKIRAATLRHMHDCVDVSVSRYLLDIFEELKGEK